jgi:SAM-dependent methyltransferase
MTTDWEARYRTADTPWDKGASHPALVRWLADHPGHMTGDVLVPGCGLGHDVRAIAAAEPTAHVVGLDVAPAAIAAALRLPCPTGATFRTGDLFARAADLQGRFAWAWEHTCFCAIDLDRRDDYVAAIGRALAPGGHLLGVFYLDPYRGDHRPGGGPPHGCTLEELRGRFERDGCFRIVAEEVPRTTYAGREGCERLVLMERLPVRP